MLVFKPALYATFDAAGHDLQQDGFHKYFAEYCESDGLGKSEDGGIAKDLRQRKAAPAVKEYGQHVHHVVQDDHKTKEPFEVEVLFHFGEELQTKNNGEYVEQDERHTLPEAGIHHMVGSSKTDIQ